jgi:hypothetical protein
MAMQSAEVAPTAAQVAAARTQAQRVMARWAAVKAKAPVLRSRHHPTRPVRDGVG